MYTMDPLIEKIKNETRWYQRALLIEQFHKEKVSSNGKKRGEKWTLQHTANALQLSIGYVSESLTLCHREELKGLSRNIALKVIRENGHKHE